MSFVLFKSRHPIKFDQSAYVELPVSLLSNPTPPGAPAAGPSTPAPTPTTTLTKEKKKKHHLTVTTDPLYGELQDLNFSAVGKKLNKVAHRLDEDYKVHAYSLYGLS